MMNKTPDDIRELIDRYRVIVHSEKNRRNRALWADWPAVSGEGAPFPITIEPEAPMWGDILGFGLTRFYNDAAEYVRRNLQICLWRFERWDENTPLELKIRIWMGVSFEASLFGARTGYSEHECPWLIGGPVVGGREDLDRLGPPDFRTSGLMPKAHELYERIVEMLPEDFEVEFPDWERSPFGVCNHLRTTENFLVDMLQDPEFAHRQIEFMTACRKQWIGERAAFLGREVEPGVLLNDEVNGELFPPWMYESFALPGEIELGRDQGVTYWHSCGDVTDFLPLIRRIPGLEVFHVGPVTDVAAAARQMDGMALQVCLDPMRDVQRTDDESIRRRMRGIVAACRRRAFTVRADGLHTISTLQRELSVIDHWFDVAREVRDEVAPTSR